MSIPSWAVRGAKVVCVRSFVHENALQREHAPVLPAEGNVYTIASVDICAVSGIVDVILIEIETKPFRGDDIAWDLSHFRPAVPPKTEAEDVALFHDLIRQPEHA